MKTKIHGLGLQGEAIAYAMHKLGYEVFVEEQKAQKFNDSKTKLQRLGCTINRARDLDYDVVISCLPSFLNLELAERCVYNNTPYCDLGNDQAISLAIRDLGREMNSPVFPDLGLAPGLINILAANCQAKNLKLMAGALPICPKGELAFNLTSCEYGIYVDYTGVHDILRNGKIESMGSLSEIETIYIDKNLGVPKFYFEAAHTKNGLGCSVPDFNERGYLNYEFKSIRYSMHFKQILFLLNECRVSRMEFKQIMHHACPPTKQDFVVLGLIADDKQWFTGIMHDEHWTAMQKVTACTAGIVADMLAKRIIPVPTPTYFDVPLQELLNKLNQFGIVIDFSLPTL